MKLASFLAIVVLFVVPGIAAPPCLAAHPQTTSDDSFPNKSITVYVADFDLQFAHTPNSSGASSNRNLSGPVNPPPSSATSSAGQGSPASGTAPANSLAAADSEKSDGQKAELRTDTQTAENQKGEAPGDESPRARAAKLVDLTATTLVKVLEQEGYSVRRLRGNASLPSSGVVLRGVFAQVDENFALRRAVMGGLETGQKLLLFVGVGNLARPEQALYDVVSAQPADNIGPLISISVYAPVGRYELDRDPSEEVLRRTASHITGDLTDLLNANPLALQH